METILEYIRLLDASSYRIIVLKYKRRGQVRVEDMRLDYLLDTKGYYQPIYAIEVKLNGKEDLLLMPAL